MKTSIQILASIALSLLATTAATAIDLYPWENHAAPYDFLFGNDFDAHQQTHQMHDGSLAGFFYIVITGVTTKDGYRVATHADCNVSTTCTVGWLLNGQPRNGTFLYQVEPDHPVFLVNRLEIPVPGGYGHFHWLDGIPSPGQTTSGYLLQLTAMDTFCFMHDETAAAGARKSKTCQGNGGIGVNLGIDIATHLNIVTSFPPGILSGL